MSTLALSFRWAGGWRGRITIGSRAVLFAFGVGGIILAAAGGKMAAARNGIDRNVPIFVIAGGWHTELALPVASLRDRLTVFADAFPGARYLVFGWGRRDYYMAREPTMGDLLGAALPGPAVMLVVPLRQAPTNAYGAGHVFSMEVSDHRRGDRGHERR